MFAYHSLISFGRLDQIQHGSKMGCNSHQFMLTKNLSAILQDFCVTLDVPFSVCNMQKTRQHPKLGIEYKRGPCVPKLQPKPVEWGPQGNPCWESGNPAQYIVCTVFQRWVGTSTIQYYMNTYRTMACTDHKAIRVGNPVIPLSPQLPPFKPKRLYPQIHPNSPHYHQLRQNCLKII